MDKRSVLAIVLITVVIILMPYYYDMIYEGEKIRPDVAVSDSLQTIESKIQPEDTIKATESEFGKNYNVVQEKEKILDLKQDSQEKIVYVETPLLKVKISNRGGGKILSWQLKKYDAWVNDKVTMINENMNNGVDFSFQNLDGERIELNNYIFFQENKRERYNLSANDSIKFEYELTINGSKIIKTIMIRGNSYHTNVDFKVISPSSLILNNEYQIIWKNGLPSNEINVKEDFTYAEAYASMGGELESFDVDSEKEEKPVYLNGNTEWVANRTKYFMAAVLPEDARANGALLSGEGFNVQDILYKKFNAGLNISVEDKINDSFKVYIGPLDYSILSDYEKDLEKLVLNHGWYEKTFRPISLLVLNVFKFFQRFIPNYGLVIILFSVIIKILVYPLTKKSYESMSKMSTVQPMLNEIREKYKNDPQRLNREMMKLYKEKGINPMGGCLPGLLQLPILASLFITFRSTIQLRGASFIPGWINDLSQPDTVATLPFSIPFYGDSLNLLPIFMALSMILQQKMTMKDPKQKVFVYVMPVFLLFLFNQFPSGLNLYYTLFNLLTIFQQKLIEGKKKQNEGSDIKGKNKK